MDTECFTIDTIFNEMYKTEDSKLTVDDLDKLKLNTVHSHLPITIYRFKFTEDFMTELYNFSKIHQYDERKDFKEAWKLWTEDNADLITTESTRLNDLGYAVEWRVVNAADFGMPQRRRRVFILAYHKNTELHNQLENNKPYDYLLNSGVLATTFPIREIEKSKFSEFKLHNDIVFLSDNFNKSQVDGAFENTGLMINGNVSTVKTTSNYSGNNILLKDLIQNGEVTEDFYKPESDLEKWLYLKGPKKEIRKSAQGFEYNYSEGGMIFPDPLDKPSRTIITGEGGKSPSRFKHVIKTPKGYRRLSPVELERLNMFPDDHTKLDGVTDKKRAFFMGNALVVGVIEKIGINLANKINENISIQSK